MLVKGDPNPAHIMSSTATDRHQQGGQLIFLFEHEFLRPGVERIANLGVVDHWRIACTETWV